MPGRTGCCGLPDSVCCGTRGSRGGGPDRCITCLLLAIKARSSVVVEGACGTRTAGEATGAAGAGEAEGGAAYVIRYPERGSVRRASACTLANLRECCRGCQHVQARALSQTWIRASVVGDDVYLRPCGAVYERVEVLALGRLGIERGHAHRGLPLCRWQVRAGRARRGLLLRRWQDRARAQSASAERAASERCEPVCVPRTMRLQNIRSCCWPEQLGAASSA